MIDGIPFLAVKAEMFSTPGKLRRSMDNGPDSPATIRFAVSAHAATRYSNRMNGLLILVLIIAALWVGSKILKRTNTL